MVSIDFYVNETTRHADVILPPTGPLERDHYDIIFHLLAVRDTARWSPALFEPEPGARADWEIARDLGAALLRERVDRAARPVVTGRPCRPRPGCGSARAGSSTRCCARPGRGCRSPSSRGCRPAPTVAR